MLTAPRTDPGSVLFLFPAALLVMVVLGALAIDVGYVQIRGRELEAIADSAANDALAALDIDALRAGRGLQLDPTRLGRIVAEAIAAGPHPDAELVDVSVIPDQNGEAREIIVTLRLQTELVMAPALGDLDHVTLVRTGHAVILRG